MANIFDYLNWRGDLDFQSSGLNQVDQLILSGLAYSVLDDIVPAGFDHFLPLAEVAKIYQKQKRDNSETMAMFGDLLPAAAKTKRFANLGVGAYRNLDDSKLQTQFCAMTFRLPKAHFVAFRGTDDTLAGWKEDFNLSFMVRVPSQEMAAAYLNEAGQSLPGPLFIGGHSKGGNLAVYAAARCHGNMRRRIKAVYNNDGPGFLPEFLQQRQYLAIRQRTLTFMPATAIVGILLEHADVNYIVRTTQKGLFQHDFYKWEVLGPDFVLAKSLAAPSRYLDKTLNQWIAELDPKGRESFFDALYSIISASGAATIGELTDNWLGSAVGMLKTAFNMDDDMRKLVNKVLSELAKTAARNMSMLWQADRAQIAEQP